MILERRFLRAGGCALLLIGAWMLFFWPILIDGRVPVFRDILDTTVPLGQYIGARLREGKLPQWFPYEALGEPFIGQLNESTFHPITWLYAILPVATALRWELLLGYLAAAVGQLLFARKLGLSWTASALAAIGFAFSGYALSLSNVLPYLWGMASLPWLGVCAFQVHTEDRPWPWVGALALVWATMVVAGDSHSAVFGGLVAFFVSLHTGRLRRLPLCVLASALAIGLAGAELLPAIDIVKAGPRTGMGTPGQIKFNSALWALHPHRLPELLLPAWIPTPTGFFMGNIRYHEGGVWALSIYPGTPVVGLALAGLISRSRTGFLSAAVALFGLWLATGWHGGLEPALRHIPLFSILRYPEKHLAILTLTLPLAAGAGLDWLRQKPRLLAPVLFAAFAAGCAVAAMLLPPEVALRVWPQIAQEPKHIPLLQQAWHDALRSGAASLALTALILALALWRARLILLLPISVFFDLWLANGALIGVVPARLLTETPRFCASARAAGAGPAGFRAVNVSSRIRRIDEMDTAGNWAALSLNQLEPAASALCEIGTIWTFGVLSNEPRAVRLVTGRDYLAKSKALMLYGFGILVRAFPDDPPIPDENVLDTLEVVKGKELLLVSRPAAPRAYASVPHWVPDFSTARREIEERGMALLESPALIGSGPAPSGSGKAGAVTITTYQPEYVVLDAEMTQAGAVVLNDLAATGWSATVDGQPATIYRANALARGVLVPQGKHRIEMRFELPRLNQGLALSGVTLLGCLLLIGSSLRRRKDVPAGDLQREYWKDQDAAHFSWQTTNEYLAETEARLLEGVAARPGEHLLEIGCGEGANLHHLSKSVAGATLFAVDFTLAKAAFVARTGVRGACADAMQLPFRAGAFDVVLVRDLLHHVPDRRRVLEEAVRVLKPGGRITVIEPNGRNPIIAAMALAIPAERGMLSSRAAQTQEEAKAAGFQETRVEERQPLPLSRVVLHYKFGLPGLARFSAVRTVLRGLERAGSVLPRSLWSYFVVSGTRPG